MVTGSGAGGSCTFVEDVEPGGTGGVGSGGGAGGTANTACAEYLESAPGGAGTAGSGGPGGDGYDVNAVVGGGGGGGFIGGGGGVVVEGNVGGGGGGGSSFIESAATNFSVTTAAADATPEVAISWTTGASPTISTTPSPATTSVGSTLQDSATLAGAGTLDGTGTITFNLYGPDDAGLCTTTPVYSETVKDISGDGPYSTTTGYVAEGAGTYYWTASFSGDSDDAAASSTCGAETVTVGPAATVASVSTTEATGSYTVGAVVPVSVTFRTPVVVTGTPQLALDSGGTASYASGSGTSTLIFDYTVAAGQNAAPLDYSSTGALALNGGTIEDGFANNANLALPVPASTGDLLYTADIIIDTTAPVVKLAQVNGAAVTFPFASPQSVTSVGGTCGELPGDLAPVSVTVNGSPSVPGTATCSAGTWTLSLTAPLSAPDSYALVASQSDNAGTGASRPPRR